MKSTVFTPFTVASFLLMALFPLTCEAQEEGDRSIYLTLESGTHLFEIHRIYPDKVIVNKEGGFRFTFPREEIREARNPLVSQTLVEAGHLLDQARQQDLATFPTLASDLERYRTQVEQFAHVYDWLIPDTSGTLAKLNEAEQGIDRTLESIRKANWYIGQVTGRLESGRPLPAEWTRFFDSARQEVERIPYPNIRQAEGLRIDIERQRFSDQIEGTILARSARLEEISATARKEFAAGGLTLERWEGLLDEARREAEQIPEIGLRTQKIAQVAVLRQDLEPQVLAQSESATGEVRMATLPLSVSQATIPGSATPQSGLPVTVPEAKPEWEAGPDRDPTQLAAVPQSATVMAASLALPLLAATSSSDAAVPVGARQPVVGAFLDRLTAQGRQYLLPIAGGVSTILLLALFFLLKSGKRKSSDEGKKRPPRKVFTDQAATSGAAVQAEESGHPPQMTTAASPTAIPEKETSSRTKGPAAHLSSEEVFPPERGFGEDPIPDSVDLENEATPVQEVPELARSQDPEESSRPSFLDPSKREVILDGGPASSSTSPGQPPVSPEEVEFENPPEDSSTEDSPTDKEQSERDLFSEWTRQESTPVWTPAVEAEIPPLDQEGREGGDREDHPSETFVPSLAGASPNPSSEKESDPFDFRSLESSIGEENLLESLPETEPPAQPVTSEGSPSEADSKEELDEPGRSERGASEPVSVTEPAVGVPDRVGFRDPAGLSLTGFDPGDRLSLGDSASSFRDGISLPSWRPSALFVEEGDLILELEDGGGSSVFRCVREEDSGVWNATAIPPFDSAGKFDKGFTGPFLAGGAVRSVWSRPIDERGDVFLVRLGQSIEARRGAQGGVWGELQWTYPTDPLQGPVPVSNPAVYRDTLAAIFSDRVLRLFDPLSGGVREEIPMPQVYVPQEGSAFLLASGCRMITINRDAQGRFGLAAFDLERRVEAAESQRFDTPPMALLRCEEGVLVLTIEALCLFESESLEEDWSFSLEAESPLGLGLDDSHAFVLLKEKGGEDQRVAVVGLLSGAELWSVQAADCGMARIVDFVPREGGLILLGESPEGSASIRFID